MSSFSFLLGFATSRCLIDRTLWQADALLLRSEQEYEREQTALMGQFQIDYKAVETKLALIREGKANH